MPGFDRTGPLGRGPLTGGGRGPCGGGGRFGRGGGRGGRRLAWQDPSGSVPVGTESEALARRVEELERELADLCSRVGKP